MPSVATVSTGPSGPRTWRSRTAGPGSTLASTSVEEWSRPAPAPVNHHWDRGAGHGATARARPRWLSVRKPNSPAAAPPVASTAGPPSGGTSTTEPRGTSTGRLSEVTGPWVTDPPAGGCASAGAGARPSPTEVLVPRAVVASGQAKPVWSTSAPVLAAPTVAGPDAPDRPVSPAPTRASSTSTAGTTAARVRRSEGRGRRSATRRREPGSRASAFIGPPSGSARPARRPRRWRSPGARAARVAAGRRRGRGPCRSESPPPATRGRPAGWRCRS